MIRSNKPTVTEMCNRLQNWADDYYRHPAAEPGQPRQPTREASNIRDAMKELRSLFADKLASDLTLEDFEACQELMIRRQLAYTTINARLKRLRTALREGRRLKLIPSTVIDDAALVRSLKPGRTDAKAPPEKQVASWDQITDVMAEADLELATMIEVHARTGMRPCELVAMRQSELIYQMIGQSRIMIYQPQRHKTAYRGHHRSIAIGPEALVVLQPWLSRLKHINNPSDQVWRFASVNTYSQAVRRLIVRVNKQAGHPYLKKINVQMIRRHFATWFRNKVSLEQAQQQMGHKHASTTEIYAKPDELSSWSKMAELG